MQWSELFADLRNFRAFEPHFFVSSSTRRLFKPKITQKHSSTSRSLDVASKMEETNSSETSKQKVKLPRSHYCRHSTSHSHTATNMPYIGIVSGTKWKRTPIRRDYPFHLEAQQPRGIMRKPTIHFNDTAHFKRFGFEKGSLCASVLSSC